MTRLEFRNRLCILRSIDRHELVNAGLTRFAEGDGRMWNAFAADPYRWFLQADDETAEKLWRVIERRALPTEVNGSSMAEARAALEGGNLPDGYSINRAGALVIPDKAAAGGLRGSSVILARFDEVVTVSGRVVKSRDGVALKAARAS